MSRLSLTATGLAIDGEPALIQAGVLHYARLPAPELWEPVLHAIRMTGLNAVLVPFPWAYHSPAPGFHDFTGLRDVRLLLDAVARAGLWLIPHIGPWLGMDLDGGGLPAWLHRSPESHPILSSAARSALVPAPATVGGEPPDPGPSPRFLRHVATWWEPLLRHILAQPNLLTLLLDPGQTAAGQPLPGYAQPLVALARRLGVRVPLALPDRCINDVRNAPDLGDVLPWVKPEPAMAARARPLSGAQPASAALPRGVAWLDLSLPVSWTDTAPVARAAGVEHPRPMLNWAVGRGFPIIILDPFHSGINWGWEGAVGSKTLQGFGAAIGEAALPLASYYDLRRLVTTFETLGSLLTTGAQTSSLEADPPQALRWARRGGAGTLASLTGPPDGDGFAQLALGNGDAELLVEDIPLPADEVHILPLDWSLADGRMTSTTLEPVLHTIVAGRELVILRNRVGGEVVLPSDFRPRHTRGPVYEERVSQGRAIHFDPAKIASVVLDGPEGHVVQLLALEPARAERVWALDDAWRTTPALPATWTPPEEAPARGVVIGPDFVIPEGEGAFRFTAVDRGFGYRWGPWRGSDPHTWLSPITWQGAPDVDLPTLAWNAYPGAHEVLPDYADRTWRALPPGSLMTTESLGIDHGFVWYRAHFEGAAAAVTLACRHACDLFLNGEHIASLNPPPDFGAVVPKTLPLPARYLRAYNVLALLIENQGRAVAWDAATLPHGLISLSLDGAAVDAVHVRGGLDAEVQQQGFYGFADWSLIEPSDAPSARSSLFGDDMPTEDRRAYAVTWHRATFDLRIPPEVVVPLYLILDQTPTKTYTYLNGQLIGRLWYPHEPDRRLWLPDGLLRRDRTNELLVAQWTRGATPGLGTARLHAARPARWQTQTAT